MKVRTRFAPSPTGFLHIGGARTALFCWLYARKTGGDFILRIEDTDLERSTQASVDAILDAMQWLGLDFDEGPFYQTQRFDRYKAIIQQLLDQGDAYHCYCTKEELESLRESQMQAKQKPRYDGRCEHRTEPREGVSPVVRFRNPKEGTVLFDDLVRGPIEISNNELDDLIIARSDGSPTYNLSVVVDDIDMQITHVIRGDDHINNTPRQINIMHALGADIPKFGHVPMILGHDGKRLSKRHGAVGVMQYQEDGYLPEALLNYLVRLGWSHGDQEIFSREEMIALFELTDINRAPSAFNIEKSLWLNQHYIKTMPNEEVAKHLQWHMQEQNISLDNGPSLESVIDALKERAKTLTELAQSSQYFYNDIDTYDEKAVKKQFKTQTPDILNALHQKLAVLSDSQWQEESALNEAIMAVCDDMELKLGKVGPALRIALTGSTQSPSLDITLKLIGKLRSLDRIKKAAHHAQSLLQQ